MWPLTLLAVLAVAALADATVMGLDTLEEEKRAPLGFNGMRGKKDDLLDDGFDKRGGNSLGFSGMRGKKDDLLDDGFDKRGGNSLGFSGMRGKKSDEDADDAMDKRARNQLGFSGMRGKKDDYDLDVDDVFDKRTRNMLGFSGMRGKKASSDEYVMDDLVNKRARNQLGFSGMRGKKDGMDDVEAYLAKRARQAAFVGMRGRRENGQAFFGMRGKRNPGDGFGTFDTEDGGVLGFLRSPEAARDGVVTYRSKRYLPYNWQLRNSKKAPFSGFIGLRGKKSVSVPSFFRTDEQRDLAK